MFIKHGIVGGANHAVKGMVLPGKLQVFIRNESLAPLIRTLCSAMKARIDDVSGILIRKWLEQHVIDDAENRRAGANTERESDDRHQGETRVALELAACVVQVLPDAHEEVVLTVSRHRRSLRR